MIGDVNRERLRAQLVRHEGLKLRLYRDSVGKWSIGVGRNLEDNGLLVTEAYVMLDNDISTAIGALVRSYPQWFIELDPVRQAALVNVMFNLGPARFAGFHQAIAAFSRGDYATAARELLDSTWSGQVGPRAVELAAQVRSGQWRAGP
jgi:lysozyme